MKIEKGEEKRKESKSDGQEGEMYERKGSQLWDGGERKGKEGKGRKLIMGKESDRKEQREGRRP